MTKTPSARTLERCSALGWAAGTTESWVPFAKVPTRRDLLGFIDIVCATGGEIIGIQATSRSNVSARVKKIKTECADHARKWLESGGVIEVWGWGKMKKRDADGKFWQVRCVRITKI